MGKLLRAEVAELVDAPGSGSGGRKPVGVRVSSSAPIAELPSPVKYRRVFLVWAVVRNRAAGAVPRIPELAGTARPTGQTQAKVELSSHLTIGSAGI
jgi:hypothetical protein